MCLDKGGVLDVALPGLGGVGEGGKRLTLGKEVFV